MQKHDIALKWAFRAFFAFQMESNHSEYACFGTSAGSDIEDQINDCVVGLWGLTKKEKPNWPQHWTGMTVIDRVKSLGGDYIRYYQHSYHYCNWSLHSVYIEPLMSSEKTASLLCAHSYAFANQMFLSSSETLIDEFPEFLGVEVLRSELQKTKLRGAQILWDVAVNVRRTENIGE